MKLNQLKKASNPYEDFVNALVANEDTVKGTFTIWNAGLFVREKDASEPALPATATAAERRIDAEKRLYFVLTAQEAGKVSHLLKVRNREKNAEDNGVFVDSGTSCQISFYSMRSALASSRVRRVYDAMGTIDHILATVAEETERNAQISKALEGLIVSFVQTPLEKDDKYTSFNGTTRTAAAFEAITEIVSLSAPADEAAE